MASSKSSGPQSSTLTDTDVETRTKRKPDRALPLGRVFARYVVLQKLGSGGAGTVYAAYDPELDRKLALKVLNDERERARKRLMREAQAIARVTHPNIVAVHDVGTHKGRVYIAMEFVDGMTFRRWLAAGTRSWREIVAKARGAGEGLAAAHDAGLVHRDFKPDNVLVDRSGRVVVLDFGLARRASARGDSGNTDSPISNNDEQHLDAMLSSPRHTPLDQNITGAGALMGTPAYMAPEQHLRLAVDARTDQFSFCVVVWEALFGERPFPGNSPMETGAAVTRGELTEPRRASAAPVWVRRVLEQGLRPQPAERHEDMRTLLAALARDPWRARKRVLAVGALVLGAGGAAALLTARSGAVDPCAEETSRWAGVWDPDRSQGVSAAFAATGLSYADKTYGAVAATLDGYVRRWNTVHREACEATHVLKIRSAQLMELQWACLGHRRSEVAALTDELLNADVNVVEHAIEAVQGLRRLDACEDLDGLSRRPAPPSDRSKRRRAEALETRLVDAQAKARAARYDRAVEIATDVATRAQAAGALAVAAEAKLLLGRSREAQGHFEDARRWLLEAIWAGQASGHDEVVARAWTRLVWVEGVELVRTERGELWGAFADAAVKRAGDPPALRAALVHNRGGVLYRQGRLEQARLEYLQALEAQQAVLGPDHPQIATTLNHIANALIELERYDDALGYAERSAQLRQRVLGHTHPKVAASLNNVAELHRKQGNHAQSLSSAKASLAIVRGRGGPEELVALTLVGEAQLRLGEWEAAAGNLRTLLRLREAAHGPTHAGLRPVLRRLAEVEDGRGNAAQAEALRARAEAIAEAE